MAVQAGAHPPPSSSSSSSRVMLFMGGLGAHRLSPLPFDDLAERHDVRILTVDRPGHGHTTPFESDIPSERLAHFHGQ